MKKILLSTFLVVSMGYINQSRAQCNGPNAVNTNFTAVPNSGSQVDFDNSSKYSETRTVRGEGKDGKIVVYPNPSMDGKVNISFEDVSEKRNVSLADMNGRIVKQWKGVTYNNITIVNLTPGMYTLRVVFPETGEQIVEKVSVNKR